MNQQENINVYMEIYMRTQESVARLEQEGGVT
jgi:hypothetical protein